jgi:hypothetical protein
MFAPIFGLALATLSSSTVTASPNSAALSRIASWVRSTERQRVSIWTDHDESPYHRGDRARVYFQTETDGYITVLRVDTDGRIRVLFPREPWEDNFARGGRNFEVLDRNDDAFSVDDYPGVGYVFVISSPDPYRYDDFVRGDHWDYRLIADGRVRGDPYVALTDFASQIAGPGEYDYDVAPYYVDQHYDYPRFVCYDCHSYVSYSYWDPYHYSCNRFRIVIYDDYYYYPYRYYRGRNVVFVRPYRPRPRYVFKDWDGRGNYVSRERQRPSDDGRRISERDRTSADVGGRGSIPAPVDPRRRVSGNSGSAVGQPDNGGQGSPRRRTGETDTRTDRPSSPANPEPRRRSDENPSARPGDTRQPTDSRDQEPSAGNPRRREPEKNSDLQEVDPQSRDQSRPDRRGTDQRSTDQRGTDQRPSSQPSSEPRRSDPSSDPRPNTRSDPRRSEPSRSEPSRSEPSRSDPGRSSAPPRTQSAPPRVQSPPPSRGQPTGEPTLRRRKPD